jgi:hypothetical protein
MLKVALVGCGCLVTLAAVTLVLVARSEMGRKVIAVAMASREMAEEASHFPGAEELRQLGCQQALKMDLAAMVEKVEGDKAPSWHGSRPPVAIMCVVESPAAAVACDEVARTWVEAVGGEAPRGFQTGVVDRRRRLICKGRYLPDGSPVTEAPAGH